MIQKGNAEKTVITTLDLKLDQEVQKLAKNYFESLKNLELKIIRLSSLIQIRGIFYLI